MNIFYLDPDPRTCARLHCDKHVVKMVVEYAQLLSTAHRVLDGQEYTDKITTGRNIKRWKLKENDDVIYKACHVNHPSAIWTRENRENYRWLRELWLHLCIEYTYRYEKIHATEEKLQHILVVPPKNISSGDFFQPPPAMKQYPQCIVKGDSIQSYINYYREAKSGFAKWSKRPKPDWWHNVLQEG